MNSFGFRTTAPPAYTHARLLLCFMWWHGGDDKGRTGGRDVVAAVVFFFFRPGISFQRDSHQRRVRGSTCMFAKRPCLARTYVGRGRVHA